MALEKQILSDYQEALKNRDTQKVAALSFLRSSLLNLAIEKSKKELDDQDVIGVIKKHVKKCQESIEQFKKGNREDLVLKESQELKILQSYLPEQLDENQLNVIVGQVIQEIGATSIKDMGKVMKEVMSKVAGKADGKQISDAVKSRLSV